jgi:biotin carboxyl carrier protein
MANRTYLVEVGETSLTVEVEHDGTLRVAGEAVSLEDLGRGEWRVVIDGLAHRLYAAGPPDAQWIWFDGVAYRPQVSDGDRPSRTRARDVGSLTAPMPATVRAIRVSTGEAVKRGDTLVVLEAMKMELPLRSPADGTVKAIACEVGELVQPGVPLVELA